jgi:hypothetical protein
MSYLLVDMKVWHYRATAAADDRRVGVQRSLLEDVHVARENLVGELNSGWGGAHDFDERTKHQVSFGTQARFKICMTICWTRAGERAGQRAAFYTGPVDPSTARAAL